MYRQLYCKNLFPEPPESKLPAKPPSMSPTNRSLPRTLCGRVHSGLGVLSAVGLVWYCAPSQASAMSARGLAALRERWSEGRTQVPGVLIMLGPQLWAEMSVGILCA